jgi:AcrR family transcriptional regulator
MSAKIDRKTEILYAAARLFVNKGYRGASLQELADQFGFTKPALYHYFSSKKQLLYEILSYAFDVNEETVAGVMDSTPDAEERLRRLIVAETLDITNREIEGDFAIVLAQEAIELSSKHRREIARRRRAYFELHRGILDELKTQGRLRDVDTTVAAFGLINMMTGVSQWFQSGGRLTAEQVAEEVAEVAVGLLLK